MSGERQARPVPSAPHPRQRRRKLRRRRRRRRRGRLRGDCSNSIYRLLPPLSPPPRHVDAAHWPRAPSAARAAQPRLLPPPLPPSRATRAHAATQAPPLPRTAPRNPDRGRCTPRPHSARCVRLLDGGRAWASCSVCAALDPHPTPTELQSRGWEAHGGFPALAAPRGLPAFQGRPQAGVHGWEGKAEGHGHSVRAGLPGARSGWCPWLAPWSPRPLSLGHPDLSPSEPRLTNQGEEFRS